MSLKTKTILTSLLAFGMAPLASAQAFNTIAQFFNNNPGGSDLPSSGYNWSSTTANGIATVSPDVSQGNTGRDGVALPGERPLGSGFMFVVPVAGSDIPGASFFYTNHTGVSNDYQPNPQPDWFAVSGTNWLAGLTTGDIPGISFRSNAGSNNSFQAHLALQVSGHGWVVSTVGHTLTTTWQIFDQAFDLSNDLWITGVFNGTTLLADPTGNPTVQLTGSETVSGFGLYAITGSIAGNSSRVRLDLYGVEVIPEPSTYALIFALGALGFVLWRRRVR